MIKDMSLLATVADIGPLLSDNSTQLSQLHNSSSASSIVEKVNDDKQTWVDFTILCIKGVIFGTIIIGAVLGNALVIISVQRNRKLR